MAAGKEETPAGGRGLPPVTVAKLEETFDLLELLVAEHQDAFLARGQSYRDAHRKATSRKLRAEEAMQLAVAMSEDPAEQIKRAEEIQNDSSLVAYDEPAPIETLVASVMGMGSRTLKVLRQIIALVEMEPAVFEEACETGRLRPVVDERAAALRGMEAGVLRDRGGAALAHYAAAAGLSPGEAMSLPLDTVWRALKTAASEMTSGSPQSSLTDSAASTEG